LCAVTTARTFALVIVAIVCVAGAGAGAAVADAPRISAIPRTGRIVEPI
jgi:hypothetical protein